MLYLQRAIATNCNFLLYPACAVSLYLPPYFYFGPEHRWTTISPLPVQAPTAPPLPAAPLHPLLTCRPHHPSEPPAPSTTSPPSLICPQPPLRSALLLAPTAHRTQPPLAQPTSRHDIMLPASWLAAAAPPHATPPRPLAPTMTLTPSPAVLPPALPLALPQAPAGVADLRARGMTRVAGRRWCCWMATRSAC